MIILASRFRLVATIPRRAPPIIPPNGCCTITLLRLVFACLGPDRMSLHATSPYPSGSHPGSNLRTPRSRDWKLYR